MGVSEQALEAHDVHVLKFPHEEAVVPLHHVILRAGGQQAQSVDALGGVAVDGVPQNVQRVAGGQKQLPRVHLGGDGLLIGPQGVRRQLQPLLGGGAHEHQRHVLLQKAGLGLQIRLHDLQSGAAPL